jgi:CubicO group peptidase (beta-lactamase class C family)
MDDEELWAALRLGERAPDGAVEAVSLSAPGGAVAHLTVGAAEPVHFPYMCAAKPIVAAALLRLVHELPETSLGDPVRAYVPELDRPGKREITLLDLLTHRTGITREPIPRGWKEARIRAWIAGSPVDAAARAVPRYGMFTSWYLVGLVIERLTGTDRVTAVRDLVLRPLGLRIGFGPAVRGGTPPPVGVLDVRSDHPRPLDWISDPRVLDAAWAGTGMWGDVGQLAAFYSYVLRPHRPDVPPSLARALAQLSDELGTGMTAWDAGGEGWGYSAGAYTGPGWVGARFAFPAVGVDAATGTFGFADHTNGIVLAYASNLMRLSTPVLLRRRRIVAAAYRLAGIEAFP